MLGFHKKTVIHNNPVRSVIRFLIDQRLQFLLYVALMAEDMKATKTLRIRSFTRATSNILTYTCKCAIDLVRQLLANGHAYVMLNCSTTDPLDRTIGKLRQGAEGAYFFTAQ